MAEPTRLVFLWATEPLLARGTHSRSGRQMRCRFRIGRARIGLPWGVGRAGVHSVPGGPRLVGRAKELGELEAAIAVVRDGNGHVVLVKGDAGIGKSRLVAAARASAEQRGCLVIQAACFESDRIVPYAAVSDLLPSLLTAEPSVVSTTVRRTLAPDLVSAFPELRAWPPDVAPAPTLEPEPERRRLLHAVGRLLEVMVVDRPLMIVVEDLHWADDATVDFMSFLVRSTPTSRFLLVLTPRLHLRSMTIRPGR